MGIILLMDDLSSIILGGDVELREAVEDALGESSRNSTPNPLLMLL
jgi:hypothetical protein